MRRRAFITLLGGATVASWPLAARAQQAAKLPTIGLLGAGTRSGWADWVAAFVQRLQELGWIEGRTVAMEVLPPLVIRADERRRTKRSDRVKRDPK